MARSPPLARQTQTAAYTVANYPVQASDKNAVAAKDKALNEGQQAAFRSLLKRIVPVTSYKQLTRLKSLKAADMISGVAVRSERNSATEYIASLDFSFQADAVRSALSSEGIPFVDLQAEAVTVVIVTRKGSPAIASNDSGPWRQAWTDLDLSHTVTPVKIDDMKPVIHNDTVNMLLSGDDGAMRILADEYKTNLIVFAVAEPDLATKKLAVTLAGQDAVGPLLLKRDYRLPDGDVAYASELAAVVALGVIEGRWKAVKSGSAPSQAMAPDKPAWSATGTGTGEPINFAAEFSRIAQWNEIRTQHLDTPGVEDMDIVSVSDRNADVTLHYPGGLQGLANAIGGRGLSLANSGGGWVLRAAY